MSKIEQTLSIIKPDAVERNLQDQIKEEFTNKGFEIIKEKKIHISKEEAENAVLENRKLMGATNPVDAEDGTLRKKYGISIDKNSVHGSDSIENAKIELDFFFNN